MLSRKPRPQSMQAEGTFNAEDAKPAKVLRIKHEEHRRTRSPDAPIYFPRKRIAAKLNRLSFVNFVFFVVRKNESG
jgi:hypothetical protein